MATIGQCKDMSILCKLSQAKAHCVKGNSFSIIGSIGRWTIDWKQGGWNFSKVQNKQQKHKKSEHASKFGAIAITIVLRIVHSPRYWHFLRSYFTLFPISYKLEKSVNIKSFFSFASRNKVSDRSTKVQLTLFFFFWGGGGGREITTSTQVWDRLFLKVSKKSYDLWESIFKLLFWTNYVNLCERKYKRQHFEPEQNKEADDWHQLQLDETKPKTKKKTMKLDINFTVQILQKTFYERKNYQFW